MERTGPEPKWMGILYVLYAELSIQYFATLSMIDRLLCSNRGAPYESAAPSAMIAGLPYRDRAKPFNFILSPVIDPLSGYPVGVDPLAFTLIAPFTSNPSKWYDLTWMNLHDGKSYQLGKPGSRLPHQAEARTYGDVVAEYRWHPEAC